MVPGHEIVGRIAAIGSEVTKFKVGDIGGVGCMVASCRVCDNCLADREQNCLKGNTLTYAAPDKVSGGQTYGGYSERVVVDEHFVIRMPPGADLAAMTPLLCAGITTFSPLQHWKVEPGQRVGVVGLGGLGHVAVKLAVAKRAEVTVFTTTPAKVADAQRLGARQAVLWNDAEAMRRLAGQFDFIIATVPQAFNVKPFLDALKLDGTLVNVGALAKLEGVDSITQIVGRKSLKKLDQPVSKVCRRFTPMPQVTKNVRYRKGERPTENAKVCAAIASGEQRLNGRGRLIVRPSGTEPVIRVTGEGDDADLIEEVVNSIVDALNEIALG